MTRLRWKSSFNGYWIWEEGTLEQFLRDLKGRLPRDFPMSEIEVMG